MTASTVYLIHIEPAYKHARHYCGYTREEAIEDRLARHRTGRGAVLCRYAVAAGSQLILARLWEQAPRKFELTLKRDGHFRRMCPLCNPDGWQRRYPVADPALAKARILKALRAESVIA